MAQSQAWKNLERKVAKAFRTVRRKRGDDFSQSDVEIVAKVDSWLDIDMPGMVIVECKYRSSGLGVVDTFIERKPKEGVSIGKIGDDVYMTSLPDFERIFREVIQAGDASAVYRHPIFKVKPNTPKYVNEHLSQASGYIEILSEQYPTLRDGTDPCFPLLCLAKRGRQGVYAVFRIEDFRHFL